jgi:hypothetical protein
VSAQPGPLGEEAARLAEALAGWARGAGGELPIATGAAECALCPICQLLSVVRNARPETFAHLVEATSALAAALRSVVEAPDADQARHSGVERIDLDDDRNVAR